MGVKEVAVGCDAEAWRCWATAWELAALTLRYPQDGVLADAVASGEWVAAAEEIARACGFALADGWAAGLPGACGRSDMAGSSRASGACVDALAACGRLSEAGPGDGLGAGTDGMDMRRALRVEATRLFVGAPKAPVSPYEGVWRAEQDGVHALLMVNPHTMAVERFARACGLGRPEGTQEPLDHVATECELLEHLALRASGAPMGEGFPQADALPEGSAAGAYGAFVAEHVRTWMPRFAEALAREARHPLYRAAGVYLGALASAAGAAEA